MINKTILTASLAMFGLTALTCAEVGYSKTTTFCVEKITAKGVVTDAGLMINATGESIVSGLCYLAEVRGFAKPKIESVRGFGSPETLEIVWIKGV